MSLEYRTISVLKNVVEMLVVIIGGIVCGLGGGVLGGVVVVVVVVVVWNINVDGLAISKKDFFK